MINFRYHIVSLMAVFLALAVGIVLGVTLLSDPANETIQAQAQADRQELQDIRAQLTQRNALDTYRDSWAEQMDPTLTANTLMGQNVAIVAMPDAPTRVVTAVQQAVASAGGTVVSRVEVNRTVYETAEATQVSAVVDPIATRLGASGDSTLATRYGLVLAHALLGQTAGAVDQSEQETLTALTEAKLVSVDSKVTQRATLAVVVTATAPGTNETPPTTDVLTAHVQTETALRGASEGVVVAGPNSTDVAGTDIQVIRSPGLSADRLSTVDVADLPSGVITTVLALAEQAAGGQGHYGATGDAVAPELPVR